MIFVLPSLILIPHKLNSLFGVRSYVMSYNTLVASSQSSTLAPVAGCSRPRSECDAHAPTPHPLPPLATAGSNGRGRRENVWIDQRLIQRDDDEQCCQLSGISTRSGGLDMPFGGFYGLVDYLMDYYKS